MTQSKVSKHRKQTCVLRTSSFLDTSNADSEADLHPTLHLTSNLGLPLAGPVPLPETGYDNELMKQYQRYSGDFNQPISNLNFKVHGQSNGYVPYVDYSRDYAPPVPSTDSLTGSLSRSMDGSTYLSHYGSLRRHTSSSRIGGAVGPDVIPLPNPTIVLSGEDVRYAATYGNPYLRGSVASAYTHQLSPNHQSKPAPPPYYSVRNNYVSQVPSSSSPSSSSSSRPVTSPLASSSSTNSSAQPQVPKMSPQSSALYILPPSSQGSFQSSQITKGTGSQLKTGTHV